MKKITEITIIIGEYPKNTSETLSEGKSEVSNIPLPKNEMNKAIDDPKRKIISEFISLSPNFIYAVKKG